MTKKVFCTIINIKNNDFITYKKIIDVMQNADCVKISNWEGRNKLIEIDSRKLDELIRSTEYFKKVDDFIFKSTGGFAETGV